MGPGFASGGRISLCTTLKPPGSPIPAGKGVGEFSFSGVRVNCITRPLARSNAYTSVCLPSWLAENRMRAPSGVKNGWLS
jgi:hypothetical protein